MYIWNEEESHAGQIKDGAPGLVSKEITKATDDEK